MITLSKKISLYKTTADDQLARLGIPANQMDVAIVLDASKSMFADYKEGRVQELLEKIFGLSMALDRDASLDVFLFGNESVQLKSIDVGSLDGYVEREIIGSHKINQATNYAKAIECVNNSYFGRKDATFVIFITDGDASDKSHTKAWIHQVCRCPYYFQFVGIGDEKFNFLEKLDELPDRAVDNCGFVRAEDVFHMTEEALYQGILAELPTWLEEARRRKWIA